MTSLLCTLLRTRTSSAFLTHLTSPRYAITPSSFSSIQLFSTTERETLEQSIATKGNEIRDLKAGGISKEELAPHISQLLELKASLEKIDDPTASAVSESKQVMESKTKQGGSGGGKNKQTKKEEDEPLSINELRTSRLAKASSMRMAGVEPYAYTYDRTHTASELLALYDSKLEPGEEDASNSIAFGEGENKDVSVAGRIMMRRVFGKLAFYALQDESGMIQLQFDKKRLGEIDGDSFKVNTFLYTCKST